MGFIHDLIRKEPGSSFFGRVQSVDGPAFDAPVNLVEPESAYVSLCIEAMRVSAVRVRGQNFYGSVAGTCGIDTRTGQRAELFVVSTPSALRGVDPSSLDRMVTGTIPIMDSVPYRGGVLDIEIGLLAIPSSYLVGPYLDLLGDVASLASAFLPPVGALASTGLIPSVRKGLDQLFGATAEARLEVGLAHAWEPPMTGHYAVVNGSEPPGGFRLQQGRRLLNPDGSEVRAAYLILRLDARSKRHNWSEIPDIQTAYMVVAAAARRGDLVGAREALAAFRRAAVFSPDLLAADGKRLHDLVQVEVKRAFPSTGTGSIPQGSLPSLADIPLYTP